MTDTPSPSYPKNGSFYHSVGRFYYDKSTKTLYKYLHDRLEIKDIRCIHQGIDREKKRWQPFCFDECADIKLEEAVQLMHHWKIYPHSTCIDYKHTYYMHDNNIII